jgi:hypothetical protein
MQTRFGAGWRRITSLPRICLGSRPFCWPRARATATDRSSAGSWRSTARWAVGQDGKDWDVGGLTQGQSFANVRDKTYIWYGQMDQRQGTYTSKPWKAEGGVGLLVLDRDRFGSLSVRDPDKPAGFISSGFVTFATSPLASVGRDEGVAAGVRG